MMAALRQSYPVLAAAAAGILLGLIFEDPYRPARPVSAPGDEWALLEPWHYPLDEAHGMLYERGVWGERQPDSRFNSGAGAQAADATEGPGAQDDRETWRFVGVSREQGSGYAHFVSSAGDSALVPVGDATPLGGLVTAMGRDWVELDQGGERVRLRLFEPLDSTS